MISPKVFENIKEKQKEYRSHGGYSRIALDGFFLPEIAKALPDELRSKPKWNEKHNDLYRFRQTDSLTTVYNSRLIQNVVRELYSPRCLKLVEDITGCKLAKKPDIMAAEYNKGDRLLVHDDQVEGRVLAYTIYLIDEDWSEQDGGHLDIFYEGEQEGLAGSLKERLLPRNSRCMLLEVCTESWHQVAEVLGDKSRLSIHGFYHGTRVFDPKAPPQPSRDYEQPIPLCILSNIDKDSDDVQGRPLSFFISPEYLDLNVINSIRDRFSEESSIELENFLQPEVYNAILSELKSATWQEKGPRNRMLYFNNPMPKTNGILASFKYLLVSTQWAFYLNRITGLGPAEHHTEIRRFDPGHYTLLSDTNHEVTTGGLDVMYALLDADSDWDTNCGGGVVYLSAEEEEEILTIFPSKNSLALVYRTSGGIVNFTQYVSKAFCKGSRYDIKAVWSVMDVEGENEEEEKKSTAEMSMCSEAPIPQKG